MKKSGNNLQRPSYKVRSITLNSEIRDSFRRCTGFLIVAFIMSFVLAATGYCAMFTVTNPTEFQDALNTAASNNEDDTINVAAGTYNVTATLTYNAAENYALTIIGASAGSTILDGGSSVQILNINTTGLVSDDLAHISIGNLTLQNGNSISDGGGAAVATKYANISVQDAEFSSNSTVNRGGGAWIESFYKTVTLTNNTFSNNSSAGGGGVYANSYSGPVTLTNNTFSNNGGGGAVAYSSSGPVTLTNNTFGGNVASGDAGGAYAGSSSGPVTLTNNTFSSNSTGTVGRGGGAYADSSSGTVTLTNNTFSDNVALYGGGALAYSSSGTVTLTNNTFSHNTAYNKGGGAYAVSSSGTVTFTNNTFGGNAASDDGGGVCTGSTSGIVTLTNNTFSANSSSASGGGVYASLSYDSAMADIYNNIFWNNTAYAGGNNGDDLFMDSDGSVNGIGSPVNLFNNDLGVNADIIGSVNTFV